MIPPHALLGIASTDVTQAIPKDQLRDALGSPPFVHIPGTFNARDLGLLTAPTPAPTHIRAGFAFRSGSLGGLTDEGKAVLRERLAVARVFDLRSVREHETQPDPAVVGVETVWIRPEEGDALVQLEDFVEGNGEQGYEGMYLEVLKWYRGGLRAVLEHVRDRRGEPFLFHCNAGRDRTGVVAGMLLSLAGASADTVVLDFMLSRIGTEPAREQLLAFAMKGAGVDSIEAPGFYNLCSLRVSAWERFVEAVEREYGGWDGYVTNTLGFSEEDLVTIKRNLKGNPKEED